MASKNRKARKAAARAKRLARLAAQVGFGKHDDGEEAEVNYTVNQTTVGPASYPVRTYNYTSACRHEIEPVFKLGRASIIAGSSVDVKYSGLPFKLLVSCAGTFAAPEPLITISAGARAIVKPELHAAAETPYVAFAWPDGGVPQLGLIHWGALAESIAAIDGNVGIYCLGGHGRTGTALAILASLAGLVPAKEDPVEWVRERYCDLAVETEGQCRYITRITGRLVTAEGSDRRFFDEWRGGAAVRTGGYEVTPTGVRPLPTQATSMFNGTSANSTSAQTTLPLPPPKPQGVPIVNAAGDVIGYDYTYNGNGKTEILAGDDDEYEREFGRRAGEAEARDRANEEPWQKWGK